MEPNLKRIISALWADMLPNFLAVIYLQNDENMLKYIQNSYWDRFFIYKWKRLLCMFTPMLIYFVLI